MTLKVVVCVEITPIKPSIHFVNQDALYLISSTKGIIKQVMNETNFWGNNVSMSN